MPAKAPPHLSRQTRAWWRALLAEYQLAEHHVRLLTLAAEAWARAQQARELLSLEGMTYRDAKTGAPRKHPAVSIEENARIAFARLIRELDLDNEPMPDPRLPRIGG